MSFAGSSLDEALARLSQTMGVNCEVGLPDEAAWNGNTRVVWTPSRMRIQPPHEQPADGKACAERWIYCSVELRAPDFRALVDLADKLEVGLYTEFSENTFQRNSDEQIDGAQIDASGYATTAEIGLLFPVYAERYGAANVQSTEQARTVNGEEGP